MYTKRQNPAKSKLETIMTKSLIITIFVALLASCSVPQTVRYTKTTAHPQKKKKEIISKKADDELYLPETKREDTDKSIENFEEMLMKGKRTQTTDVTSRSNAPVERKRIPTLREQMVTLGNNQVAMRNEMQTMKDDMNDIRKSVNEIKKAVYGINDIVMHNKKSLPTPKNEKKHITKTNHPNVVKTNILLPNEKSKTPTTGLDIAQQKQEAKKQAKSDFQLGKEYYENRNIKKATTFLTKVIRKNRNSPEAGEAHYLLGKMNYEQKNYNQSISHLKRAMTVKGSGYKDNAQALLAEAYIRSGNNNMAKDAYKTLIANYPQSKYVGKARKMLQQL